MAIKNNLREILDKRGIKYAHVAEKVDISKGTLSNILSNRFNLSLDLAIRIYNVLVKEYRIRTPFTDIFYDEK